MLVKLETPFPCGIKPPQQTILQLLPFFVNSFSKLSWRRFALRGCRIHMQKLKAKKVKADLNDTMTLGIASRVLWKVAKSVSTVQLSSSAHVEPSNLVWRNCRATKNTASTDFVPVKSKRGPTFSVPKKVSLSGSCEASDSISFALSKASCHLSIHYVNTSIIQSLCRFAVLSWSIRTPRDCSTIQSCRRLLVSVCLLLLCGLDASSGSAHWSHNALNSVLMRRPSMHFVIAFTSWTAVWRSISFDWSYLVVRTGSESFSSEAQ